MFAQIKHAAIYTQNPGAMIAFYEKILGMKRITTAVTEDNRGHISDGLIGLAVLARRPGIPGRPGSFRLRSRRYRDACCKRIREQVSRRRSLQKGLREFRSRFFAATIRPARSSISPSAPTRKCARATKKTAGIKPRQFNHVVIRAAEPRQVAEFYQEVFELFEVKEPPLGDAVCLSDGKVRLLILPTNNNSYISMRQGLDHIGFKVESIEQTKKDLDSAGEFSARVGAKRYRRRHFRPFHEGGHGRHARSASTHLADPDGVLLDFSEN